MLLQLFSSALLALSAEPSAPQPASSAPLESAAPAIECTASSPYDAAGTFDFEKILERQGRGIIAGISTGLGPFTGTFQHVRDQDNHLVGSLHMDYGYGTLIVAYELVWATDHYDGTYEVVSGSRLLAGSKGEGTCWVSAGTSGNFSLAGLLD